MLRVLAAAGADLGHVDNNGRTFFHTACVRNHLDAAKLFLEHGADVRAVDSQGKGVLHLLAANERGVTFLPFLPLSIGSETGPASTPLGPPERQGTHCLDVNLVDSNGKTALFIACEHRRTEFVKALVELGHPDCDLSPTGDPCSVALYPVSKFHGYSP